MPDRLVPYSCKRRGFCPSCGGRRMADTAAHLVDHVLPEVPVRQWVLTLPVALRYRMAFDAGLTADVHRAFIRTLFASLRRLKTTFYAPSSPPTAQAAEPSRPYRTSDDVEDEVID